MQVLCHVLRGVFERGWMKQKLHFSARRGGAQSVVRRLWQPRKGLFWLMVAFNVLSSAMGVALRMDGLPTTTVAIVAVLALLNAGAGMCLAWRLLRGD